MSKPFLISQDNCQGLTWQPPLDLVFAANTPLIPLHLGELSSVAATMPLAAVQSAGEWQLVGVCATTPEQNLFIRDGKWLGAYAPQWLTTWPFTIIEVEGVPKVALEDKSLAMQESDDGEIFFNDTGEPGPALADKLKRLKQRYPRLRATQKALTALAQANVLTPWPASIGSSVDLTLKGLHMVDEKALSELSDEAYLSLRRSNSLGLAYVLNLSLTQTHLLARLSRLNVGYNDTPENLDELFGEGEDEFSFDFDS